MVISLSISLMTRMRQWSLSWSWLGLVLSFNSPAAASSQLPERPPQFILISFDGSYTNAMWEATRNAALASQAKVTHFISGVDFLTGGRGSSDGASTYQIYTPPRYKGGPTSLIGFGGSRQQLMERIRQVYLSYQSGMEIGGHANGHFDGSAWSEEEWTYEFDLFHKYILEVFRLNRLDENKVGVKESDWQQAMSTQLFSFRAPFLGRGEGLWKTLGRKKWNILGEERDFAYSYDASDVARSWAAWPSKSSYGFWYFRMATIPVEELGKRILSMDYNFYVAHSDNPNNPKDKPEKAQEFEEQMYRAYLKWFLTNYYGNRAPINIGHHFSTWNQGAYWKALQRFMDTVCREPEVACVTGGELVQYLEGLSAKTLAQYEKGQFNRQGLTELPIALSVKTSQSRWSRQYPLQKGEWVSVPTTEEGWRWYLPHSSVWLNEKTISLRQLYRQGQVRIDLVHEKSGKVYSFQIGGFGDALFLSPALPVDEKSGSTGCSPESHKEQVDERFLKREQGIRI